MQEMIMQTKQEYKAFIDEENCIGCGKCIRVCPTDAIVGSKQVLHTILPQLCTSCSNCINTCPTDCITLSTLGTALTESEELVLTQKKQQRLSHNQLVPPTILFPRAMPVNNTNTIAPKDRKQSVADAIARVKAKKNLAK
jgi:Na+-translocating ferredoxin:NAD+ oxidoreductase subunit B